MAACVRAIEDVRGMVNAVELRGAWADWIELCGPWDWFTTHTFREDVSPERALALFHRWLARLAEACRHALVS